MSAEIESISTERGARQVPGPSSQPWVAALAGMALLLAAFGHVRLAQFSERDDRLRTQLGDLSSAQTRMERQVSKLSNRLDGSEAALQRELAALRNLPATISEFGRNLDEVRARTETPQRAWVGAEAGYLLELAQRRLVLESDVGTAIAAMSAADARLATLGDPAIVEVRRELAREIAALRAVQSPDFTSLLARLDRLDASVADLPILGVPADRSNLARSKPDADAGGAAQRIAAASRDLFSLRRVDPVKVRPITREVESLRRQHLQLLLLSARVAAMQRDPTAYASALAGAEAWLLEYFIADSAAVEVAQQELRLLAEIQLDPPHPAGIGNAAKLLQRIARTPPTTEPAPGPKPKKPAR
jgi:uroporphyrin-3 C-methyltransferase